MRTSVALLVACLLMSACADDPSNPLRLRISGAGGADSVVLHLLDHGQLVGSTTQACPCEDQTLDLVLPATVTDPVVVGLASSGGVIVRRTAFKLIQREGEVAVTFAALPCPDLDGDGFCVGDDLGLADCDDTDAGLSPIGADCSAPDLDAVDTGDLDSVDTSDVATDTGEPPVDVPADGPDTIAPLDTDIPDTGAPDTAIPDTAIPDTAVPEDIVPDAGDTAAPDTDGPCIPSCQDKTCGPDGCGGVCGPGCAIDQACAQNQCLAAGVGEWCADPIIVQPPVSLVWSTGLASADHGLSAAAVCGGAAGSATAGPDHVIRVDPLGPTTYKAELGATYAASLWAFTNCGEPDATCLGFNASSNATLEITVDVGQSVFFVVDGFEGGDYALTITSQ